MRFNDKADVYDHHAIVQKALADWTSEWLFENKNPDFKVLELGAGTGTFTEHLYQHFETVDATDNAPAMVEQGRKKFPGQSWFLKDGWEEGPETWDLICNTSLLQWAPDPLKTLRAWEAQLSPQGRILAGHYAAGTLSELAAINNTPSPVTWQTPESWLSFFSEAGLKVIRHECEIRTVTYPSALAFFRSLHQTGALQGGKIGYSAMKQLIRDYENRYSHQSGVFASWHFMRIEATKRT